MRSLRRATMANGGKGILAVCRLHMNEAAMEELVCWRAGRVERSQALAGDRAPLERFAHVVHRLSGGGQAALRAPCLVDAPRALGPPLVSG